MPVISKQDASDVEEHIDRIFRSNSLEERISEIRRLFVETLDFEQSSGVVSLEDAPASVDLPATAYQIASLEDAHVVYVHLDTSRVRKAEASETARLVSDQLGGDILMVVTNDEADQLHFIYPTFDGIRPTLRRMVVERDLPRRTAIMQIANIFHEWESKDSIHLALESAFDVEAVTKDFFSEYKRVFDDALTKIGGFGTDRSEQEAKKLFTQALFNRLMFVYFLQRKAWLTFKGDNDYLNALWKDYRTTSDQTNFYNQRLAPLFFAGLNNPQSRDLSRNNPVLYSLIGAPPFLNGGLFERSDLDKRDDVTIPDSAIGQILSELFEKFNFTVMESTSFDIEVAVDPEMLGKVFEKLVTGRNESGSYYTPRPVVSFMCREALKGYLDARDTTLSAEAIGTFVDNHDTSGVSVAAARSVGRALEEITVVDPACGSGAYLLGMMQELVELQTELYNAGLDAKSLYDLKLQIIERNLYGADIDPFAINIAMLRLWLSLAIEYDDPGDPPPLPNLDFKIVCGDSLLGPDPSPGNYGDLFRHQINSVAGRLADLKARYMEAIGSDKATLRDEIASVQARLTAALADSPAPPDAVDWRVEFGEVFATRGGFDVAVANPPYIQLQRDGGRLGRLYRDSGFATYVRSGDIYQLFYERGCQLLQADFGLLAYITSNSWLKAEYGKSTRRFFSERHTPLRLLELGKDVFDGAIVDSGVLLLRTGEQNGAFPAVDMDRLPNASFPPDESLWGQVRPSGEEPWSILSRLEQGIMDKMRERGTHLKEWDVKINYGIKTGYNKAFIIDDATRDMLVDEDPRSADIIKPILRGRDIQRYRAKWAGKWLIVAKFGSYKTLPQEFPAIHKHLLQHEYKLRARGQCRYTRSRRSNRELEYQGQHHWLELDNNPQDFYLDMFAKEKLFWIELVESGRFAYDNSGIFGEATTFVMTGSGVKYLCAILNSTLIRWFLQQTAPTSGMGTPRWKKVYIETIPIPNISAVEQRPFTRLVDEILDAKSADPDADTRYLEWDIDRLVYDLYGLTEEEDTEIERSLGLIHQTDEQEDAALVKWIQEGRTGEYVSKEVVMETLRISDGG